MLLILLFQIIHRAKLGEGIYWMITAMCLTLGTEVAAWLYINAGNASNHLIYIIGNTLLVFLCIFIYYWRITVKPALKRIQAVLILLFLLNYAIAAIFVDNFFKEFQIRTYLIQIILMLVSICIYFYESFNSEKVLQIRKYYSFWVSLGFAVIYFGLLPVILIGPRSNINLSKTLLFIVMGIVNLTGYSILLTGIFFAGKPKKLG